MKVENIGINTKYMEEEVKKAVDFTSSEFNPELAKTETRKYSKDPRKAKIQKLKEQIKAAEDNVVSELSSINVEEEMKEKLFKTRFTTKEYGHGFGLLTCKRIVESHKGEIEAESQPGQGATFRVRLPSNPENKKD